MDWRVRIAWWLLAAVLLVSTLAPAEAGRGGGSRGGGSRGGGSRGSSSGSTWGRNRDRGRNSDSNTYKHVTSRPVTSRYGDRNKVSWSSHHTTSRPIGWNLPPRHKEDHRVVNSISGRTTSRPVGWNVPPRHKEDSISSRTTGRPIGWNIPPHHKEDSNSGNRYKPTEASRKAITEKYDKHYKPTEASRKAVTEKYDKHYKPTEAPRKAITEKYDKRYKPTVSTPTSTTHHHRHGHQNHTKLSKHNTTSSHNVSKHGGHLNSFQTTQRLNLYTKPQATGSYNASRKAVTEKYDQHYKPIVTTPTYTIHHQHGHKNSTKVSKHNTTSSHNVSRHGGNLNPFQTTQRPSLYTEPQRTGSYNASREIFQMGGVPGHVPPSQQPSHQRRPLVPGQNATSWHNRSHDIFQTGGVPGHVQPSHWPPPPASTSGPIGWNVPGTNTNKQPPGPGFNVPGSNVNQGSHAQAPGAGWNFPGTNTNKQPPGPGFNAPGTNPVQPGSHGQPPASWNVPGGGTKQQPSGADLSPPHQAQPGWNVGSGTGSKVADYPRQPAYNPNYHGTQQAPPPYNPNYHGTQQAPPPYNPNYHGTQQAPPPYSPPGHAPSAYNPNQPPPAYSPGGHPPSYPGYPTHQAGYPGYQQGYPGYQNHPGGYPTQGHYGGYGGYNQGYPSYPGGGGGGYYSGYHQGYPGSPGFGHYPGGYYPGGGSHWSPPGYTSSYGMMPGAFGGYGGGGGGFFSSSYHSSPFGYSKSFFRPSFPMIIFLPIPHYHYPSSIPPRRSWKCDCYVQDKTAVCTYKLSDDHIPSCVSSSVNAVFIQSREVDRLSVDAFRHVPRLEYLNITDTKLRSLPRDLFRDTRDLKHLLVQNNPELRSLDSDLFRDASKLEDVILDRNDISSLDRDVFTHLTNVKRLNLAYNKIRSLPEGIFRDNRELQELGLSGNPLRISSDTARDLLRNNAKLRVLLMRDCKLEDLPTGLLRNATNLEWLDLSSNEISKFPSEFIQDCSKLGYLGLAYNKLKVLGSDVLHQRGGSLATLELEGNPWRCDCDLLPLAGWATLRKDAVPGRPKCSSPHNVENEPLERWFHSKDAMKCGGATSSLRTDLNRVMAVARAIAKQNETFFANLLPVSDEEVGFAATNYFLYAMAARTDADVDSVVWHWARFLEKVLDRRHLRYAKEVSRYGINQIDWDKTQLLLREVQKDPMNINVNYSIDPLATTTTKPPKARDVERPPRPKGFEPLVNFTYVVKDVPENLTKVVDDGIEEELKILFGVINGTNATSPNATASNITSMNSTGNATIPNATISNTTVLNSAGNATSPNATASNITALNSTGNTTTTSPNTTVTPAPGSQNTTSVTTTSTSLDPTIMSASSPPTPATLPPNPPSVVAVSVSTPLPANASGVIPVNATLNMTSLANSTSPTNQTVTSSNSSLTGVNGTTSSANGTVVPPKKLNATEQMVAGLRSELREVLSTLLLSIDRAKWDAAYQKSLKEEEEKTKDPRQPKPPTSDMNKRDSRGGAGSYLLIRPQLTVLVALLTVLAQSLI